MPVPETLPVPVPETLAVAGRDVAGAGGVVGGEVAEVGATGRVVAGARVMAVARLVAVVGEGAEPTGLVGAVLDGRAGVSGKELAVVSVPVPAPPSSGRAALVVTVVSGLSGS